jgi:hypothetical protein
MNLTTAQLQTLKTELQTDPRAYGYAPHLPPNPANWNGPAALLNLVRDGTNGGPAIVIRRTDTTPLEILEAIDIRDFPASPAQVNSIPLAQSWLESITQFPTVRLFNDDDSATRVKTNLDRLLGNANGSQTRLNATPGPGKRHGSRGEELFGRGADITDVNVEAAWRLP